MLTSVTVVTDLIVTKQIQISICRTFSLYVSCRQIRLWRDFAMIRYIALAAFLAILGLAGLAQAEECLTVKAGIAREIGRLKSDGGEKSYCVYARAGQTMKVTVRPISRDLVTQGHVMSPNHQVDGGPGGVIFDQKLSEEGRYEIRVGQRYEKKSGEFELSIELK
jgi:hypothetical protein